jgi:hypothetical protein
LGLLFPGFALAMVLFLLPLDVLDDHAVVRPRGIHVGLCRVAGRPEGLADFTDLVPHAAPELAVAARAAEERLLGARRQVRDLLVQLVAIHGRAKPAW